jgi:hypothetical protein
MQVLFRDFGDARRVANKFQRTAGRASIREIHYAFAKIVREMDRAEGALFRSQGRRGGGGWKRLKQETIRKKGNSRILFTKGSRSGYQSGNDELYGSLTQYFHKYKVLEFEGYNLAYGTDRPGARAQHFGSARQNIPARPIMKFTRADEAEWKRILLQHMLSPWQYNVTKNDVLLFK